MQATKKSTPGRDKIRHEMLKKTFHQKFYTLFFPYKTK